MSNSASDSRSVAVYKDLEEKIVTLQIQAGHLVTEQDLCQISGFGRTPVREAIQKLQRDMLVSVLPRRGVLIEPIDAQQALKTMDVRRRLEPFLTERAVKFADDVQKWRFKDLAARMEETEATGNVFDFIRLDREMNEQVAQAARHDIACQIVFPLHAISRRIGYLYAKQTNAGPGDAVETHSRFARAIAEGDLNATLAALETTFDTASETALRVEAMINRGEIETNMAETMAR